MRVRSLGGSSTVLIRLGFIMTNRTYRIRSPLFFIPGTVEFWLALESHFEGVKSTDLDSKTSIGGGMLNGKSNHSTTFDLFGSAARFV